MQARVRAAAAAAVMLAVTPVASAHAQTTPADAILSAFRSLCWATGGDRAAALAAAERAGWFSLPADAMAASAPGYQNPVGRLHTDSSGFQFLILGEQSRPVGARQVRVRACGVGGSTPDVARLEAGAQEIAAVPKAPALSAPSHTGWIWSEAGGRRTPVDPADAPRFAAALDAGALRLLSRSTRVTPSMSTGLSMLTLGVPLR